LARIFRIPIGLDYSWFLVFVLLTWSLATNSYPAVVGNWSVSQYWMVGAKQPSHAESMSTGRGAGKP
jgi:hypothetical protein